MDICCQAVMEDVEGVMIGVAMGTESIAITAGAGVMIVIRWSYEGILKGFQAISR